MFKYVVICEYVCSGCVDDLNNVVGMFDTLPAAAPTTTYTPNE